MVSGVALSKRALRLAFATSAKTSRASAGAATNGRARAGSEAARKWMGACLAGGNCVVQENPRLRLADQRRDQHRVFHREKVRAVRALHVACTAKVLREVRPGRRVAEVQ